MGDQHATENKAKLKPPAIADRPPAPAPKKPIRNLRVHQLKPLDNQKTRVTFAVGAFEGVWANATAELIGLGTFQINMIGPHDCSGDMDMMFEKVRDWHKDNGRAVIRK